MPTTAKEMKPSSTRAYSVDEATNPFTTEELLEKGHIYVLRRGVMNSLQDDAAQEFAVAGMYAVAKASHTKNIRAFQLCAGKWAVSNLRRSETRRRKHEDAAMYAKYGGNVHELTPETLADRQMKSPVQQMIAREESQLLKKAIGALPDIDARIMEKLVYDNMTQHQVAKALGLSRGYVGQLYNRSLKALQKMLIRERVDARLRLTDEELYSIVNFVKPGGTAPRDSEDHAAHKSHRMKGDTLGRILHRSRHAG